MGGPTYSGMGRHHAVKVNDGRWPLCLFCGRVRSTDHVGTFWLSASDPLVLPREGHSQAEQSEKVKGLAIVYGPKKKPVEPTGASAQADASQGGTA
jgi:hypothetical protein